jgi:hypothetical protein
MADGTPKDLTLARREGLKLFYDVFKHLTTLASGSILVLVTFLGRVGDQPAFKPLVAVSFIGFLSSSVASVVVMLSTARTIRREEKTDQLPDKTGNFAYIVAVVGFAVGVFSLSIFGYRNL